MVCVNIIKNCFSYSGVKHAFILIFLKFVAVFVGILTISIDIEWNTIREGIKKSKVL